MEFLNDGCSIVSATSHENRHSACHYFYYKFLDPLLLVICQSRGLACGGEDAKEICAIFQLIFHQLLEYYIIYSARRIKGRYKGYSEALEYVLRHNGYDFILIFYCKCTILYVICKTFCALKFKFGNITRLFAAYI